MKILLIALLMFFTVDATALDHSASVLTSSVAEVKYAEEKFKLPVSLWLGHLPGNDEYDPLHASHRRSTLIIHRVEPKADRHHMIVWFHGMGGYHKFATNMFPQVKELIRREKSFTIVIPEMPWSCNVNHIDGRKSWIKAGSFTKFVDAAKKQAKIANDKPLTLVVGGHSRGGKAIRDAAVSGELCEANPNWIIWSDATYSEWLSGAWKNCLMSMPDRVEIFYIKGTETAVTVKKESKQSRFKAVHVKPLGLPWYHGKVGDNALVISEFLK